MEDQVRQSVILFREKKISLSELYLLLRDIEKEFGDISETIKKYADISTQLMLVAFGRLEREL